MYYYNRKYGRDGHLFKERFKSEPVNDMAYFTVPLRYIHQNPVKAGIVEKVKDYEFSSWGEYDGTVEPVFQICDVNTVLSPGEQAGYAVTMYEGEDFHDKCAIRIKFKHDARVSELVFNYTNRANKLFPESVLEKKVEAIKAAPTFSDAAYTLCKDLYYAQVEDKVLNGYLAEQGKTISPQKLVCFTEAEKQDFYQKWPDMARRMASLLIYPNLPRVVRLNPDSLEK